MEKISKIEFEVGQKYTNEKGIFEVVSLGGGQIVMKFENGEQIKSDIELQHRIQKRRLFEQLMQEEKLKPKPVKSRRSSTRKSEKKIYAGLVPDIFQAKISSTKWRSRDQLGGCVTSHLPTSRFNLNSWPASGRNEIHWADSAHWKTKKISSLAKFFACADETSFAWGFYIERPDDTGTASADWEAFIQWLSQEENDQWIRSIALEEGLEIYDNHKLSFGGVIKPRETDWLVEGSSIRDSANLLSDYINSLKAAAWLDLMIAKRISKADAINRTGAIVEDIASLFGRLLPLYEAAVSHLVL